MTRTGIVTKLRWCAAALVLAVFSGLVSTWRLDPDAPRSFASTVVTFAPRIFTVTSAQGPPPGLPVRVCTKKPVTGEKMIFTLNSSSATSSGSVVPITTVPSDLNFAGLTGPAGLFASNISIPAGNYQTLNLTMDATMVVRGVITCDVDGAGPLPTRTYYTNGNPTVTVPDQFVLNPADANPVDTAVTSGGGNVTFAMPVPFSVVAGANTTLSVLYDTNEGFGLWDISVITGVPDTYKIVPNDMTILAAAPGGP